MVLISRWSEVDNACLPGEKQPPLALTPQYEGSHNVYYVKLEIILDQPIKITLHSPSIHVRR